jgi:hypothetical protein
MVGNNGESEMMEIIVNGAWYCPFSSIVSSDEIPRCIAVNRGDFVCWGDVRKLPAECPLLKEDIVVKMEK